MTKLKILAIVAVVLSAIIAGSVIVSADPGAYDLNGKTLILDADGDSSLSAAVDDTILLKANSVTVVTITDTGVTVNGTFNPTSVNGLTITTGTDTFTLTRGSSTLTRSGAHTLTLTTTGATNVTLPTSGTLAVIGSPLSQFAATTSAQLAGVISDETGSGLLVFDTSPTLVTPTLGVASATSINKVAITAPATSATITIADGKTLTASNTLTFTGTDGSSIAFGTGGTVAYTANNLSVFAATTSAQLFGVISDETGGTGVLVGSVSPTLTTPNIGAATGSSLTMNINTNGDVRTISTTNSSSGSSASLALAVVNDAGKAATLQIGSSTRSAYGAWTTGSAMLYTDSAAGLAIMSDNAAGTIRFAAGSSNGSVQIEGSGVLRAISSSNELSLLGGDSSPAQIQLFDGDETNYSGTLWLDAYDDGSSGTYDGQMRFRTGVNVIRLVIDKSGNFDFNNYPLNNVGNAGTDITSTGATFGVKIATSATTTAGSDGTAQLQFTTVSAAAGIQATSFDITNLSTTPIAIGNGSECLSCLGSVRIRLTSVEGDWTTFTVYGSLDAGVAHRCKADGYGVTDVPSNSWTITGIGDGRTYTMSCDSGSGIMRISIGSGTATGTTNLKTWVTRDG